MANTMLTTIDNPYNPFKHFEEWLAYDEMKAREEQRPTCCGYLARIATESQDISENELDEVLEMAIDEICELNLSGKFLKISEEEAEKLM